MGQVLVQDTLPDLVIASTTTITMATTYLGKQTRISVGGQQYLYSSVITINFATTGINGLDTGAIAANSLYYIYSVQTSNTPGLVASLAAPTTGPTGFTAWKEVGRCRTFFGSATLATITNKLGGTSAVQSIATWQSFTPTGSWTTNTAYSGRYMREGSNLRIKYGIILSGVPGGTAQLGVNLPLGYSLDTASLFALQRTENIGVISAYQVASSGLGYTPLGWAEYDNSVAQSLKARFMIMNSSNIIGQWIDYTPTFNNVTITVQAASYRRLGSSIQVRIDISAATDATGVVQWNMVGGLTGITVGSIGSRQSLGNGYFAGATNNYIVDCDYSGSGTIAAFRLDAGVTLSQTDPAAEGGVDTNDRLSFTATFPVVEWSTITSVLNSTYPGPWGNLDFLEIESYVPILEYVGLYT